MERTLNKAALLSGVVLLVGGGLVGGGLVGLGLAGCDGADQSAVPEAPTTREFALDERVRYVYRDPIEGLRHVADLEDIPLEQRAATILYANGDADDGSSVYVADLLEASEGETVQARPMTMRAHFQHVRAAERGAWQAKQVLFFAREHTKLDRRSERSEASREAKELLDEIVPRETNQEFPR